MALEDMGLTLTLLGRLLKHMAAMGVIREFDVGKYVSTELSTSMTVPAFRDAVPVWYVEASNTLHLTFISNKLLLQF
jgi:hypothetical protein